jgi:hypothetical protein
MRMSFFLRREIRWFLESYADPGPDGLLFVGSYGHAVGTSPGDAPGG